jgi:5-methylcytosine-specific restriction endonuclease McrA
MTELLLTDLLAENYEALQNFLNDKPVKRGRNNGGNWCKGAKRRDTKNRRVREQGEKCLDCGIPFPMVDGKYPSATADHVIPFRFGSNFSFNCEFVCDRCNNLREHNRMHFILKYFGTIG